MPEDQMVVKSRVYERHGDMQIGGDFFEALDEAVAGLIDDAAERAQANERKTIQARDV